MYNKGYDFCKKSVRKKSTPIYVKKQMREYMRVCEGKNKRYCINEEKISQIENILKLLIMPKGLKAGQTLYECTCGYQWLFYFAILAVVHRDNPNKRRYSKAILEICRKNFKTYTVATIFILLFFVEPRFSSFFSVAPDGALSRLVKDAIEKTLKASPLVYLYKGKPRFKLLRDEITFELKESTYTPLNYSNSTLDGRYPNVFLADEVGALPNNYAVEAMSSGQINILNKLGCIISTKYPSINNPFEDEVGYAKKVLDKILQDDEIFALLYEPDETKEWATDDNIMKQGNPAALEVPEIWAELLKKRARAIAIERTRENFLTKHCNIIYSGANSEAFVDINDVQKCRVSSIEWAGRDVYIGVDLAMTNDNCSVAMVAEEDGRILAKSIAFIPEGRIEEKTQVERVDYQTFVNAMYCIACGDRTVDYGVIESFVLQIEEEYGVTIKALGYDRYNALSSAQKWENARNPINCIQIRQHSDTLHPPTKLLSEKIENGEFEYEENPLLEINFENARCTYDTNMNRYVNKKKSNGKIDMVVSIINALYLLQQDIIFEDGFIAQVF